MERFKGLDFEAMTEALQAVTEENPTEFKDLNVCQLRGLVIDKQYIGSAMKADICSSKENSHVWGFERFKGSLCYGCSNQLDKGLMCLKCLMKMHLNCYFHAGECELQYLNSDRTTYTHLFSNKTIDGSCEVCRKPFTPRNVGTVCRWCFAKIHPSCKIDRFQSQTSLCELVLFSSILEGDPVCSSLIFPLLVFINPYSGDSYGKVLFRQFLMILHPMQVIDISVTDPGVGFERFARAKDLIVIIIGGDRTCSYILKSFSLQREILSEEPKFRFIPLGPMAEVGRTFGGRIRYSRKTADYLIKQLPKLYTYSVRPWSVNENPVYNVDREFCENFLFSFALGVETYEEKQLTRERLWIKIVKGAIPTTIYNWYVKSEEIKRWGVGPEPSVKDYIELEINGQRVDLSTPRFVAIIFVNRIIREDEREWTLSSEERGEGLIDIYGITEYFKLTKRNLKKKAIKLGETSDIRVNVTQFLPYLADGYSGNIRYVTNGKPREMKLKLNAPIRVLAVSNDYSSRDRCLTFKGRREHENKPLDTSECFLEELEKKMRAKEVEREVRAFRKIQQDSLKEAARKRMNLPPIASPEEFSSSEFSNESNTAEKPLIESGSAVGKKAVSGRKESASKLAEQGEVAASGALNGGDMSHSVNERAGIRFVNGLFEPFTNLEEEPGISLADEEETSESSVDTEECSEDSEPDAAQSNEDVERRGAESNTDRIAEKKRRAAERKQAATKKFGKKWETAPIRDALKRKPAIGKSAGKKIVEKRRIAAERREAEERRIAEETEAKDPKPEVTEAEEKEAEEVTEAEKRRPTDEQEAEPSTNEEAQQSSKKDDSRETKTERKKKSKEKQAIAL